MSHDIFDKWSTIESYKSFDSYEEGTSKTKVNARTLTKQLKKALPLRYRRSTITAKLLLEDSYKLFDSKLTTDSISNMRIYSYIGAAFEKGGADGDSTKGVGSHLLSNNVITITEMFMNYTQSLDMIRS
jgi:hypothetical protein